MVKSGYWRDARRELQRQDIKQQEPSPGGRSREDDQEVLRMDEVKMSRLRMERVKRGWSLEAVAKVIGVSYVSVSNWEQGKAIPAVDSAIKLARLYGLSVYELFNA